MSNYSSKTKVPVAVKTRSSMDLSHITIASQDFGNIVPISCQYLVPGDEFNIKVSEFTRVLPMVNPTFAKVDSVVRGFVVPINYIWKGFNNFVSGLPKTVAINSGSLTYPDKAPCFSAENLRAALLMHAGDDENGFVDSADASDFDFYILGSGGSSSSHYKFNNRGRKVIKHLQALGYNIDLNDSADQSYNMIYSSVRFSALPLIAFAKFYLDWVVPARFLDQFSTINAIIEQSFNSSGEMAVNLVYNLLNITYDSFLDNDYFTAAWKEPNHFPNDSLPGISFVDSNYTTVSAVSSDTSEGAFSGFSNSLTIQSLGRLQSMINRNMIAGDKIKDWLKVEFGIEPNLDSLQMSTYLGMFRNTMRISDIMSTADTEQSGGVPLGSYAGRALLGGDGTFSYKAKQHCILVLTHEIIPKPLYYLGLQPHTRMLTREDFFIPEYDNLGTRAIDNLELYAGVDKSNSSGGEVFAGKIFGFAPQYANLKFGYDNVIGDFRSKRLRASMSSWFLGRKFNSSNILNSTPNINMTFCKVNGTTQASYDDMFAYQGTDIDHFYSLFDISIHANRPMVSVSDALTLDEEMNDRKVSVSTNNNPNV